MTAQFSKKKKPGYLYAVGRRKTASARVRFYESSEQPAGTILINNKVLDTYFPLELATLVQEPIELIGQKIKGYFTIKVQGGGMHAQAEAVRHGIARLLVMMNSEWKPLLRSMGYISRDQRVKERKKPGLKRARRAPQWSKR